MSASDIGVIGLAVMGQNLALNLESRGYSVTVYNRTAERTEAFAESRTAGKRIHPTYDLESFVASLETPRKILMMVKAGEATDALMEQLLPLLDAGDVLVDGGNAHYADTERRLAQAHTCGILYLGAGISGGEAGALHGPAIMAGGCREAYIVVGPMLEAVAAQGVGGACCAFLGPASAGHYVKMVHNGIEYAIMQALAEAYDLMRRVLGMSGQGAAEVFAEWNRGPLASYLVEITASILRYSDEESGRPLVEMILDTAAQKGTGKWSSQSALDLGTPAPSIAAAVFARIVSSLKGERGEAEALLPGPEPAADVDRSELLDALRSATLLAVVIAYAQGMRQLRDASKERGYGLDLSEVARVWTAGCIIRSQLLTPIAEAFKAEPELPYLLLAEPFRTMWIDHHQGLRRTLARAHEAGIPVPVMSSSLNVADAYRTARLPANLLQAQRDFFGAHTYRRVDRAGSFHTEWESP
ncbi:MAG: NADP-dependent phosphogluconate dehydrogenase [Candidatus Bipolaricaulota bacterium]|nr:MAG: NADP-dependent phosphogluconate dehydrogenase [Candidatus Bipolaricaulota bacterium]